MNGDAAVLHWLTHRHTVLSRDGVGTVQTCALRWSRTSHVSFRPDFIDAGWWDVPDTHTLETLCAAASAYEAMAILRAAS